MIKITPLVLDKDRKLTGSRSDDQLSQVFLNFTGASTPTIDTLMRLKQIIGISLDHMVTTDEAT